MPNLCKISDFSSAITDCIGIAGVEQVRIVKAKDIDLEELNSDLSFYFDTVTGQFTRALPLKEGKSWATLSSDFDNVRRTVTRPFEKPYFDFSINSMRFQGFISTIQVAEMNRVNELITATKLLNGQIIVDGIEYNRQSGKIERTKFIPPFFSEILEDSNVFDEKIGTHTILNIKGRQKEKGYLGLFYWESMNNLNDFGIYIADSLFAFITDDNSLFTFN